MALFSPDNPSNSYIIPVLAMRGHLQRFLDEGWDLAWATDQRNLDRVAVLGGTGGAADVYAEILYYHRDTGTAPPPARIEESFPTSPIPWDTTITVDEAIAEGRRKIRTVRTHEVISDLMRYLGAADEQRMVEVDDITGITALVESFQESLQATGPTVLPFRLLSLDDIDSLPDPEILIEGLIDHGTVTKLVGESGKGKSFIAIDWSLCIATGRRWQGREVRKGRVLYIAAEGAFGLKKRVRAWKRTFGDVPADALVLIPDAVQLADAVQLQALIKVAKDFDVVVIDTLARTSAGLEENSAKDMGVYMNNAYKIRDSAREAGATVIIVHHTGYDTKRARGSSALFANGDGEILVEADDPHALMTMTVKKRKDGEAGQEEHLRLVTVDCGDWTSCVIEGQDAPEPEQTPRKKLRVALTDDWQTTKQLETATGLTKTTADRALRVMAEDGLAITQKDGNKNMYRLA